MIFHADFIPPIVAGRKTVTRRPVREGQFGWAPIEGDGSITAIMLRPIGGGHRMVPRRLYEVGRLYAVQPGRGQLGVANIRITSIGMESLQDITEAQAIAEGMSEPDPIQRFRSLWDYLYSEEVERQWDRNPRVWVIAFTVADQHAVASSE